MNIVQRVRYSRNCTNDSFPLPSVVDCLWYAYTESGEMVDAMLRLRRPGDLRNNGRNHDPMREWAQCGYMLISAWTQLRREDMFTVLDMRLSNTLDFAIVDAAQEILYALESALNGDVNGLELYSAIEAWAHVCEVAGWNVDDLIEDVCCDFERKHCVTKVVLP